MDDKPAFAIEYLGSADPALADILARLEALGFAFTTVIPTRVEFSRRPAQVSSLKAGDEGIDASQWNWPLDWAAAFRAGKRFGYIRATIGQAGLDPRFAEHWRNARAAGVLVGPYHYFVWNQDGRAQADHFINTLGGDLGDLPPMIDVEPREIIDPATGQRRLETVDRAVSTANLKACLARVKERTGKTPAIYTSLAMWQYMVITTPAATLDWVKDYLPFVADWTEPLDLPAGMAWAWMRQYKVAQPGELEWHAGKLDLDVYLGEHPGPLPLPEQYPLTGRTNQEVINLFSRVFGQEYWSAMSRGLGPGIAAALVASPEARRAAYTGPGIDAMLSDPAGRTGLTPNEKSRLIAAL